MNIRELRQSMKMTQSQFAAQIEEQRSRNKQENPTILPFPGNYTGEQGAPEQQPAQMGICVLNLRNNAECRLAISMLRQGNALMVIMESVGDTAEMRRLRKRFKALQRFGREMRL